MKIVIKKFKKVPGGKINVSDYISEEGLDALNVLEGHTEVKKVTNTKTKDKETTGMYGLKDSAIKEIKQRASEAGITLPKELQKITSAKQLTSKNEDVARLMAGYYAWVNYTKMEQATDGSFGKYTQHQKDVLLTYLHNIDMSGLTTGNPGSLVDAIKLHNEDGVIRSIFMKPDGSLVDYEKLRKDNKRGLGNRWMAQMQWWYNPDAKVIKSSKDRDEVYRDHFGKPGHMANMLHANAYLVEDTARRKNQFANMDGPAIGEVKQSQPINEQKQPGKKSFIDSAIELGKNIASAIMGHSNQVAKNEQNILNNTNGEQV